MQRIETESFIAYHFINKHEAEKAAKKHGKRAEAYTDGRGKKRYFFIIEK